VIHYDSWHTLLIHREGFSLGGHDQCPTYPDGPGSTGYGCLTRANIGGTGGRIYPEIHTLTEHGEYLVRYWWDDCGDDGYAVRRR